MQSRTRSADLGLLLVAIGAVGFGFRPLFARLVYADGMAPALAGFLTLAPTALLCLPLALVAERPGPRQGGAVLWALFAGAFVAAGNLAYMHALKALPVATATLIYFSYPLFVILLSWLLLGTRPDRQMVVAGALILGGCGAILSTGVGPAAPLGPLLLSLITPLSYALLLILLGRRLVVLPLLRRIGLITLGASVVMLPAVGIDAVATFATLGSQGWLGVAGLIVVCGFLPQLTTTIGVPWAGPDRASIVGALELITALAIGWTVIGEPTGAAEILGTLLIGTALVLVGRKPIRND